MRERTCVPGGNRGFSLVEMMVAMLFVLILMGGLAAVFKSSLNTFYTAGEKLSSVRRNRSTIDLLNDDVNSIGLYLTDLQATPAGLSPAQPPFYVLPNQVVSTSPNQPPYADQLFFYLDQPFQFQPKIQATGDAGINANKMVSTGALLSTYTGTFTIDCGSAAYANQVYNSFHASHPLTMIRQDTYQNLNITGITAPASTDTTLAVSTGADANLATTGIGAAGGPPKGAPLPNAAVTFYVPAQMVRYSVQMLQLDPASTVGVPCLVRDQGNYNATTFTPDPTLQQVIAENVSGFKVYLSVNPGYLTANSPAQTWAPFAAPNNASLATGWTNGIIADLNTQLATSGRVGATNIDIVANPTWFRTIPVVLRLDITTRTAKMRTDYSTTTTPTLAYKSITRSLVIVPRHFGLPLS